MRTEPECLHCYMTQAMITAQRLTDDPAEVLAAMQIAAAQYPAIDPAAAPGVNARLFFQALAAHFGDPDPYAADRERYNALVLAAYDDLRAHVARAADPLDAAVRLAAIGNILDLAIFDQVDVAAAIREAQTLPLAVNHLDHLRRDLASAERILLLGDNAGEIVFDRLLVEQLPPGRVTVAVKGGPAHNDALLSDAQQAGLDSIARVITTGCDYLGTPLAYCSDAFRAEFDTADVIIAKGMGNYETLNAVDANIYFILKVKCAPVSRATGVAEGSIVLLSQRAQ